MKKEFYKTKKEIEKWLNRYKIIDYIIVPDEKYGFIVNVMLDVDVANKNLNFIPVKFNIVGGNFNCSTNLLDSLEFCPLKVGGNFYCSENKLSSLLGSSKTVNGSYFCNRNNLTNLEHSPKIIYGSFDCSENELSSLFGCPEKIDGTFDCSYNNIKNLEFFPSNVSMSIYLNENQNLQDLQHIHGFDKLYDYHIDFKNKKGLYDNLNKNFDNQINGIKKNKI